MDYLIQLDHSFFQFLHTTFTHPYLDVFFPFITDLHKTLWFKIIVPPLLLGLFIYKYKVKKGITFFVFLVLTLALNDWTGNELIKKPVDRARPFQTEGLGASQKSPAKKHSFISGHTSNMFAAAMYLSSFFPVSRVPLFILAGVIGYSRIYNGVHFPLDVICGALWGIAIALIMIALVQKITRTEVIT